MEIVEVDRMEFLTPNQVVRELDKYIVGQREAKRAVAIALRNRWRRMRVEGPMREEISPKNIIMIGPTGVGKTEIARRLARLVDAPFIKVEATRYTEVGYVGRDVESIIRDLVNIAVNEEKAKEKKKVMNKARENAEERLLNLLYQTFSKKYKNFPEEEPMTKGKLRTLLKERQMEEEFIELDAKDQFMPVVEIVGGIGGLEEIETNLRDMLGGMFPGKERKRRLQVKDAREILVEEEAEKLIDNSKVVKNAIKRVEELGIVFIDEIDKIAGREKGYGPDVSREGVQRDLIPIVEGTTVNTRYGTVRTEHILFIAAGAFHVSKPSDLIPEIQGRFPIRVELTPLGKDDFVRILTEPENALTKQYQALLKPEGVDLIFEPSAIEEIASIAAEINARTENIGARRLHTVIEKLLEDILFEAPEIGRNKIVITGDYVIQKLKPLLKDEDITRYIL
jgi:ATP-dependent HslUV protease ATP-binding subunit HslU